MTQDEKNFKIRPVSSNNDLLQEVIKDLQEVIKYTQENLEKINDKRVINLDENEEDQDESDDFLSPKIYYKKKNHYQKK